MVVELREYLFQCGAAIWQLVPKSSIFRLPAFQDPDVRNWMTTEYPTQLSTLQAAAGDPVEIERVQNVILARALTSLNRTLSDTRNELRELRELLTRRTAVFTPARGFSASTYTRNALCASSDVLDHDVPIPSPGSIILPQDEASTTTPSPNFNLPSASSTSQSPQTPGTAASASRLVAQVQLVLPPLAAFYPKGGPLGVVHPIMGMQSARWVEDVFPAIKQPDMCWDVWGPGSGLEQFADIGAMWELYAVGARVLGNGDSGETHMKPPLKLVENFFQHEWRTSHISQVKNNLKKAWERFREIPEWVDRESTTRRIAPEIVIAALEELRKREEGGPRGLSWLSKELGRQRKATKQSSSDIAPNDASNKTRKRAAAVDPRRPGPSKKRKGVQ
ncbi:hypothetical protein MSAN_00277700 [Mycena sanguinolenta]|uniref:Uncharacterized protein n=1 Tax=Mycena sanguinolenta TaxID=230812 RepID=A0A8H6ZJG5_9AGAR|nr:hypothetical protein MSAN_00277700 [Mycena sanguinolenta]